MPGHARARTPKTSAAAPRRTSIHHDGCARVSISVLRDERKQSRDAPARLLPDPCAGFAGSCREKMGALQPSKRENEMSWLPRVGERTRERVSREFDNLGPDACIAEILDELRRSNPEVLDMASRCAADLGDAAQL